MYGGKYILPSTGVIPFRPLFKWSFHLVITAKTSVCSCVMCHDLLKSRKTVGIIESIGIKTEITSPTGTFTIHRI